MIATQIEIRQVAEQRETCVHNCDYAEIVEMELCDSASRITRNLHAFRHNLHWTVGCVERRRVEA